MNKHKIAWIALAVGIVVVLMLTWLVGVSPRLTHIKEADAQTAQIEESNKKTRDQIETLRMASETMRPPPLKCRPKCREPSKPAGLCRFR